MEAPVLYAFLLTLGAGLATGIGSAIAFFANHTNRKFLSFSLGVSAGVMIYVSFVEILHGAQISLEEILGVRGGMSVCALAFFGGMLLSALIDPGSSLRPRIRMSSKAWRIWTLPRRPGTE